MGLLDEELIDVRIEKKEKPNIGVMESVIDESFLSFNEFYLNDEKDKITVKGGGYANLFSGNIIGVREAVLDDGLEIKEEQSKIISEIDDIERYDAIINKENINSLYVLEKRIDDVYDLIDCINICNILIETLKNDKYKEREYMLINNKLNENIEFLELLKNINDILKREGL